MKFKLDENLPGSSAAVLARAGHDVDTVTGEGLTGAPDRDVVVAATAEGRILISLDVGMGDIRAYLCVPKTSSTSCDQAIFADQATDASLPSDAVLLKIDRFG